ncbi:MAG: DUF167 domain-containing protein [Luteolibacter sp.]
MKLHIRATPNARTSEIIGWETDPLIGPVLKIRIAAPPVDGQANAALREFLAKSLGLPKSRISLDKGGSSRIKTFILPDDTPLPP